MAVKKNKQRIGSKEKKRRREKIVIDETSELNQPLWAVLADGRAIASDLTYDEAVGEASEHPSGTVVTNAAAGRVLYSNN